MLLTVAEKNTPVEAALFVKIYTRVHIFLM
jgi:hypothetical protein